MTHELATAFGCIALAGAAAFALAVALAERDRPLGLAAMVTIWLLFDDAIGIHDIALPALGIPGILGLVFDAGLVLLVAVGWASAPGAVGIRIALVAFTGWAALQLGGGIPARSVLVELLKIVGFVAWSGAVLTRALALAAEGDPAVAVKPGRRRR